MHKIVCKHTVLCTVCLVAHHDDVMVWIDRLGICLIKFLYQREDERWVALQLRTQVIAALGNELFGLQASQKPAVFERVRNLFIQFVAVGQHHNRGGTLKLTSDFLCQKHHGITLS